MLAYEYNRMPQRLELFAMTGLLEAAEQLSRGPSSIAYLGNSVTVQKDGYRPHLHAGLIHRFGHDHKQVNAGFGAVGSLGSVCTMDELVIRHNPTLCFIECMTGDMGVGLHADTGPALEGILRKLATIGCSACFLNLPRRDADFSPDNPIVALYARVAAHYGAASVNLGSPLKSKSANFFRDVVHTTPLGGRRTAEFILTELDGLFLEAGHTKPELPIFVRDYSGAGLIRASPSVLRNPAACHAGRFKLTYPFVEFGPENELIFESAQCELLGLLFIIGPHSGPTLINGTVRQFRDQWSDYERLHAYFFETAFAPGRAVTITPLKDEQRPFETQSRLKIIGFLVRPA